MNPTTDNLAELLADMKAKLQDVKDRTAINIGWMLRSTGQIRRHGTALKHLTKEKA